MDTEYEPVINNWYRHQENQQHFCIIDIDELAGILEIQHANGDLDTMDIDTWYEAGMDLASEPELWSITQEESNDDSDDDLAVDDGPRYWQEEPAGIDRSPATINRYPEMDNQPEAIDERIMFGDWQDGESEIRYDMSEAEPG